MHPATPDHPTTATMFTSKPLQQVAPFIAAIRLSNKTPDPLR
jgi:hypothetical protein